MIAMDSKIASCVAVLLLVNLAGCQEAKPRAATGQIVALRMLVVNDPAYADWGGITERLGRENQLRAYRGRLNLSY